MFVRADGSLMAAPFDQGKLELTGPPVHLLDGVFVSTFGAADVAVDSLSRFIFEAFITPDSAWTVYRTTYYQRGRADIMGRRRGDSVSTPLIATDADERHPTLSPNGRWLAYRSGESGRDEIYVRPFPDVGGDKIPVSTAGGSEPAWSHSGLELFYVNGAGALVSASVETRDHFAVGSQRVLFAIPSDYRRQTAGRMYDVAPDGTRFMMVRGVERDRSVPDRLVLVTNWFDEVRAKMAAKR